MKSELSYSLKMENAKQKLKNKKGGNYIRFFSNEKIISTISVVSALIIWIVITHFQLVNPLFLPAPISVWNTFIDMLQHGYKSISLFTHIMVSMYRLFSAFFLAAITAIPLGMICGYSKRFRAIFDPFIEFYRPLPPLAYYTLLVIGLGIDNASKIALLYLAAFAPLYLSAVDSVKNIPNDRINAAISLGATKTKLFIYVIFPSSLPILFTGFRTAIGFTFTTLVAAEMVAATSGIGWMVLDASKFLRSDVIFVGIFIMGMIAMIFELILRYLQKYFVPWKGHS